MSSFSSYIGDFTGLLDKYKDEVDVSSWEGPSYDNFVSQKNAFYDASSSIEKQMDSFSKACDTYETYKKTKEERDALDIQRSKTPIKNENFKKLSNLNEAIARYDEKLNKYAIQIRDLLAAASADPPFEPSSQTYNVTVPNIVDSFPTLDASQTQTTESTISLDNKENNTDSKEQKESKEQTDSKTQIDSKAQLDSLLNSLSRGSYTDDCPRVVTDTLVSEEIISSGEGDSMYVSGRDLASTVYDRYRNDGNYDVSYQAVQSGSNPANQFVDFVNNNANQNIILSFNNGWGDAGAVYGHTMMVSKVDNGKVYFIDNANYNNYVGQKNGAYEYVYNLNDFLSLPYFDNVRNLKDMTIINKKNT